MIEGAESIWPPMLFENIREAFNHAFRIAKSWEGLKGAPEIIIKGMDGYEPVWTVDELLRFEKFLNLSRSRK